ncbi:amino acid permease, partial [Staphylococcus aureus]
KHDARRTLSLDRLEAWEVSHSGEKMRRTLTFPILLALVVANVIGAGVFVMTGDAANKYAGPAVMVSYMLAGIVAIYAARCYAE